MEYIPAKTIVTKTKAPSQWFGIDYNMNIYKGCCHGCIYCDSRSDCYQIEEFDRVRAKENALQIIRDDLRRKTKSGVVGTGAMSDPYNPFEKKLELTRHALELCDAFEFGAAVATKSTLLERDIDILQSIAEHSPVLLKVTVTTADDNLGKKIEPHVSLPGERLRMIDRLSISGLYTGILLMPVLPFLEDSVENVISVVDGAARAGAKFVYPALGVTMRQGQREYFLDGLERAFPGQGLKARYLRQFGERYQCASPRAGALWKAFAAACRERGLLYDMKSIIRAAALGGGDRQLTFFD